MTNKDTNSQSGLNRLGLTVFLKIKKPDGKALLAYLRTVHQHHTGFTETCASTCRDKVDVIVMSG